VALGADQPRNARIRDSTPAELSVLIAFPVRLLVTIS
jgi:hypothetical protein